MSEMKHFVVYNGQNQNANTDIQDQGLHELYLTPYEGGFVDGRAAATMCSYQIWRDASTLPAGRRSRRSRRTSPLSPFAKPGENPQTWPLNESHFSCEHPLSLTYVLHDMWGSQALVGSDYPATHATSGILQGEDQEMPTQNGFFAGGNGTNDPTGSTCAFFTGNPGGHTAGLWDPTCTSDSSHVGGLPNGFQGGNAAAGCPAPANATGAGGCTLNAAASSGVLPLSVPNQSLARILYEEERFGILGCDPVPTASCTNPGGVGARPLRHRAAAARRRRPARDEVRRRGDRREVLRGGRDPAQERRQRAAAHGRRSRRRHPRHRVEREPHRRRPDERGVDGLHRP